MPGVTTRLPLLFPLLLLAACGGTPTTSAPDPDPPATLTFTAVDTLAGQVGVRGSADGDGSKATFNYPVGLAATGAAGAKNGETLLYIAGLTENIRYAQVGYSGNPVGTAIGKGVSGSKDGDAGTALVRAPQGVAVGYDSAAYEAFAYWTEDDSCVVRKLTAYPLNGGRKAVTVAGQAYKCGAADGAAATARFNRPRGVVANTRTGEVFVADTGNFTLRRLLGDSVTTLAGVAGQQGHADGTGGAARFRSPSGLAMDRAENLYVTDDTSVRMVTPAGVVRTLAGSPTEAGNKDGAAADARFSNLGGVAVDENGTVYVADTGNHCVRRVAAGTVSTVAGLCGVAGAADGSVSAATFNTPAGLAYFNKQLYVADTDSQTIRRVR